MITNRLNSKMIAAAMVAGISTTASAVDFDVTVENLTTGLYMTPLLVAAHPADASLFVSGTAASPELQMMAEGGSIAGLETLLTGLGATMDNNPAAGLLAAGATATSTLNTDNASANTNLSVVAMLLPTNDGFVGLNSISIPTEAGEYTYYANAYDAGTEANDELRGSGAPGEAGFPVPPPLDPMLGTNGTGVTTSVEGFVHIHRGNIGDADLSGGVSDAQIGVHRWLNPVAKITVTVR